MDATYSGVFTLLPMLTGNGRAHHGDILREASGMIEVGKIATRIDPRHFTLDTILDAYQTLKDRTASGRVVVDVA
jgi:NADPH:quinone reductase-like Zn-dependent oxidoreductase